jgi:hypothetical protein
VATIFVSLSCYSSVEPGSDSLRCIAAFNQSNIGALFALEGANALKWLELPGPVTVGGASKTPLEMG